MGAKLLFAIITITLALIFYSIGVWSEHRSKILKPAHVAFFWLGLLMDSTGTFLMSQLAAGGEKSGVLSAHGITGVVAIVLMIVHAVWATVVLIRKNDSMAQNFHRFSMFVWIVWLVPYLLGMIMGMN